MILKPQGAWMTRVSSDIRGYSIAALLAGIGGYLIADGGLHAAGYLMNRYDLALTGPLEFGLGTAMLFLVGKTTRTIRYYPTSDDRDSFSR